LDNSGRLQDLIVDGKLRLTLDDAIALALENNLEIAVTRYDLPIAQTDLLRAKGGGATRGVAGSYQSTTLFSGSLGGGVGSAGGVGAGGAGGVLGAALTALVHRPAVIRACMSAMLEQCHYTLNYTVVSGVPIDITHQESAFAGYSQGVSDWHQPFRVREQLASIIKHPDKPFQSGACLGPFRRCKSALVARLWDARQRQIHPHRP